MSGSSQEHFNKQPWMLTTPILMNGTVGHPAPNGYLEVWESERFLGEGGFGEVTRQRCISGPSLNQFRAVKKIRKMPGREKDIDREIEALAMFSSSSSNSQFSDYFVRFLGWYEDIDKYAPSFYIVMEYAPYGDLDGFLDRHPCSEPEAASIITQVARALRYMHSLGFLHRDLKPANILVFNPGPRWHVKITDFGLTKNTQDSEAQSGAGTLSYMAPEVQDIFFFRTRRGYTSAVDIWSLGVVAYRIVTGELSFTETSDTTLYSKAFDKFITSLIQMQPEQRPNIDEVLQHEWLLSARLDVSIQQQMQTTQLPSFARPPMASSTLFPITPTQHSMTSDVTIGPSNNGPSSTYRRQRPYVSRNLPASQFGSTVQNVGFRPHHPDTRRPWI